MKNALKISGLIALVALGVFAYEYGRSLIPCRIAMPRSLGLESKFPDRLVNGDFGKGMDGWNPCKSGSQDNMKMDVRDGILEIENRLPSRTENTYCAAIQVLQLRRNCDYILMVHVKSSVADAVQIATNFNWSNFINIPAGDWEKREFPFRTRDDGVFPLTIMTQNPGSASIDEVAIWRVSQ